MLNRTSEAEKVWINGAARVLRNVLPLVMPNPGEALRIIDLGCNCGPWLAAAERLIGESRCVLVGVDTIALPEARPIFRGEYRCWDLADALPPFAGEQRGGTVVPLSGMTLPRFGLCVCVEVAEHLPPAAADTLVDNCVRAAPVVVFSAAVPGQGGDGHRNEQWPAYWQQKFAGRGFDCLDFLRERVWNDPDVFWWYRQNVVIYYDPREAPQLSSRQPVAPGRLRALVHPELYCRRTGAPRP